MDEYLKTAVLLAKEQAGVRTMNEEELTNFVSNLAAGLKKIDNNETEDAPAVDVKKAVTENRVTCLVCGKNFKLLSKRHLILHGLTPDEYRAKFGLGRNVPLVCKSLQRKRRAKMNEIRLWERRGKKEEE